MTPSTPFNSQDLWLSGLQGRVLGAESGESADYREGRLVRQLFMERAQSRHGDRGAPPLSTPENENAHWQSILEKARQDGLFASNPKPVQSGSWRLGGQGVGGRQEQEIAKSGRIAANQRFYALAAGLAVAAVGLTLVMENMKTMSLEDSGEVVLRGDEVAQRIMVPEAQVAGRADQIEAVLKRHQLVCRRTAIGPATIQIQAKVPAGAGARTELEKLGVVVPEHGRMNVLVIPE